jgi:membrane protein involved in colicin uptake
MSFYNCLDHIIEEAISPEIGSVEQTRDLKDQLGTATKDVDDQKSQLLSSQKAEDDRKQKEELEKDLERRRQPFEKERNQNLANLQKAQQEISGATEVSTSAADEIMKAIEGLNKTQDEMARM